MRPPHHLQGTCLFSLERGEAGAPATQLSFINHAGRLHRCVRGRRAGVTGVALSLLLSLSFSLAHAWKRAWRRWRAQPSGVCRIVRVVQALVSTSRPLPRVCA